MGIKIFCCLIGLIALVAGICKLVQQYKLKKRCSARVKGHISFVPFEAPSEAQKKLIDFVGDINNKITRGKKGVAASEVYSEVITYSIDDVQHVTSTGHISSDTRKFSLGQNVVTVVYDPSDPKRFHILENKKDLVFGIITVIVGPILILVPLIPS